MKILYAFFALLPFSAFAVTDSCAVPGSSVEMDMTRGVSKDLGLKAITPPKMELLAVSPVGQALADQYAKADRATDLARKSGHALGYEDYFSSYHDNGAKTLLIKYTYENAAKQKNIFVASSLVNDDECSIRFNGYVTLQREY